MEQTPAHDYVLLVEANSDDEALTKRALEKADLAADVVVVRDGEEGLGWLSSIPEGGNLPQLILLELRLSKCGGRELLDAIRDRSDFDCVPVVVLTASTDETEMRRCYCSRANSYVRKDADYDTFMKSMRKTVDYWLQTNRVPARG